MKKSVNFIRLTVVLLTCTIINAAEHKALKAFPPAKEGMKRLVIVLPEKSRSEDKNFKVELVPGKVMDTDGINFVHLGTTIKAKPLKGWGYTYYEVNRKGQVASTLIAVPDGADKVKRFVKGQPLMINYNSRLPIVVYVPEDYEIRYRIWSAPELFQTIEKNSKN